MYFGAAIALASRTYGDVYQILSYLLLDIL